MSNCNVYTKLDSKYKEEHINPYYGKTHMFRVPFRGVIVGASGSGKTNTLINLLQNMKDTFMEVILCLPSNDEPLYNYLADVLQDRLKIYTGSIELTKKKTKPNVPLISEVAEVDDKGYIPKLIIFDDLCLEENQQDICEYYIRGRKKNISCMYLTQSFYKCPKTIRMNASYVLLKRGVKDRDLKDILKNNNLEYSEDTTMSLCKLIKLYRSVCKKIEDFILINGDTGLVYQNFNTDPLNESAGIIKDDIDTQSDKLIQSTLTYGIREFMIRIVEQYNGTSIKCPDLYQAYKIFCEHNQIEVGTKTKFCRALSKYNVQKIRKKREGLSYLIDHQITL
jgi:hypothetical protein